MREKYIEEQFNRYHIFGESRDGSMVDVADSECDVVTGIKREEAIRLITDRNRAVDEIVRLSLILYNNRGK